MEMETVADEATELDEMRVIPAGSYDDEYAEDVEELWLEGGLLNYGDR